MCLHRPLGRTSNPPRDLDGDLRGPIAFHAKDLLTLSRFINLCTGDAFFATEDPRPNDLLPVNDDEWAKDVSFRYDL